MLWGGLACYSECVEKSSDCLYVCTQNKETLLDITIAKDVCWAFFFAYYAKRILTFVFLVFGIPVSYFIAHNKIRIIDAAVFIVTITIFMLVVLAVQAINVCMLIKRDLPRMIAIVNGRVYIHSPRSTEVIAISDCVYRFGGTSRDLVSICTKHALGIVIESPKVSVVCGRLPSEKQKWQDFVVLCKDIERARSPCVSSIIECMYGIVIGGGMGQAVGIIIFKFIDNGIDVLSAFASGGFNGLIVSGIYLNSKSGSREVRGIRTINNLLLAVAFFVVTVRVGDSSSPIGVIIMSVANTIIFLLWVNFRCRRCDWE